MNVTLHLGDCLAILPTLEANSIDAIVCDPPYGLSFMGKGWDHGVPGVAFWEAALRVAKPGAMLLAFGGTRTYHRLTVAIEDAGWEIRDCLMWLYGSGFPKSHDIGKAIDKAAGAERKAGLWKGRTGGGRTHMEGTPSGGRTKDTLPGDYYESAPATDAARQWDGWGTALKPAWEPIIMARKPLVGTVADNVLAWGTGGLAIDACRIEGTWTRDSTTRCDIRGGAFVQGKSGGMECEPQASHAQGRWPANLILDEEAAQALDEMSGTLTSGKPNGAKRNVSGQFLAHANGVDLTGYGDTGGASRFFYVAKASRSDRNGNGAVNNTHPTCKPSQLMKYLCKLVTPPNGVILDPFLGSGTTGVAAMLEGFHFVGIEQEAEYLEIARRRIEQVQPLLEMA